MTRSAWSTFYLSDFTDGVCQVWLTQTQHSQMKESQIWLMPKIKGHRRHHQSQVEQQVEVTDKKQKKEILMLTGKQTSCEAFWECVD